MSQHLVAPSLPCRHRPPPAPPPTPACHSTTRPRRITATAWPPYPPVAPGAARRAASHGRRTHALLGLQVGAAVQQQLHRVLVATPCCCSKRCSTMLRRRRPACHRTSSHHRSPNDIPPGQRCLARQPSTGAPRPDASRLRLATVPTCGTRRGPSRSNTRMPGSRGPWPPGRRRGPAAAPPWPCDHAELLQQEPLHRTATSRVRTPLSLVAPSLPC